MRRYELMLVIRPDVADDKSQAVIDRTTRQITATGGQIIKVAPWGRRRLAYEIQKKNEGIYAVVNFTSEPATAKELDRQLGLNESVMRTKLMRPGA